MCRVACGCVAFMDGRLCINLIALRRRHIAPKIRALDQLQVKSHAAIESDESERHWPG
jgi:hypothetical protein